MEQEATATVTVRENLGVTGDTRVGGVHFNLSLGRLVFEMEEGELSEDGFLPGRVLGQVDVTGEDYRNFVDMAKPLMVFLRELKNKVLDNPVQNAPA